MQVDVIGDEIHFDGFLVAITVATGVPHTVFDKFVAGLNNGTLFEEEDTDVPKCPECGVEPKHKKECSHYDNGHGPKEEDEPESEYDCALDDVIRSLKAFNKGGLVRWADIESVLKQLKEEEDINGEATPS